MLECVNALVGTVSREGAKAARAEDGTDSLATWPERSSVRGSAAQSGNATMVISTIVVSRIMPLLFIFVLIT